MNGSPLLPVGTVLQGRHSGALVRIVGYDPENEAYVITPLNAQFQRLPGDTQLLSYPGSTMFDIVPAILLPQQES